MENFIDIFSKEYRVYEINYRKWNPKNSIIQYRIQELKHHCGDSLVMSQLPLNTFHRLSFSSGELDSPFMLLFVSYIPSKLQHAQWQKSSETWKSETLNIETKLKLRKMNMRGTLTHDVTMTTQFTQPARIAITVFKATDNGYMLIAEHSNLVPSLSLYRSSSPMLTPDTFYLDPFTYAWVRGYPKQLHILDTPFYLPESL